MSQQKAKKTKVRLPIRAYLLYLLLASFLMTGVTFSKYITASTGGDCARTASIGELKITETGNNVAGGTWMIIPGLDLTKKAVVEFEGSEAATYVFLEVMVSGAKEVDGYTYQWMRDSSQFTYTLIADESSKRLMSWSVDVPDASVEGDSGWTYLTQDTYQESTRYVYVLELSPNTKLSADIIAEEGKIEVSSWITEAEIKQMTDIEITFRASVVQSGGFSGALAAWDSIKEK